METDLLMMTEQVEPLTFEEWMMPGNQKSAQTNMAESEQNLSGCDGPDWCADMTLIVGFGLEGKSFHFKTVQYWADNKSGHGELRLKVGDDYDILLTDEAVTDGENHLIEADGAVITPFGKVDMTFEFKFVGETGTRTVTAKKTLTHPLP